MIELPAAAWTRRMTLVEANDVNHIRGLCCAGASPAEAGAIRSGAPRRFGSRGVGGRSHRARGAHSAGRPAACRTAAPAHGRRLKDPLALALWPALPEALLLTPGETAFVGRGAADGFWGYAGASGGTPPGRDAALTVLGRCFEAGDCGKSLVETAAPTVRQHGCFP